MSDTMTHSDEVSDERLAEILAAIPRYADGSIRRAWVGRVPAPELEALVTELLSRRSASNTAGGGVFDMVAHLQRQRDWSGATFGPGPRTAGVVDHIRKELREIEADPSDITEWIDVVILALDGAWRAGYQPQEIIDAMVAKQTKNEARNWPDWRTMSPDKAIEHDRSGEASPIQAGGDEPVARAYRELRVWANEVLTAHDKRPGDTRAMDNALRGLRGAYESLSATRSATPVSAEVTDPDQVMVPKSFVHTMRMIAVVEQGAGGNLTFEEMAKSAMRQASADLATLDRGRG